MQTDHKRAAHSQEPDLGKLTDREKQILYLLATGDRNRELANLLGISERTVRAHITNLSRKLGLRSRTEAALLASARLRDPAQE